jgi:hypothetical protein
MSESTIADRLTAADKAARIEKMEEQLAALEATADRIEALLEELEPEIKKAGGLDAYLAQRGLASV